MILDVAIRCDCGELTTGPNYTKIIILEDKEGWQRFSAWCPACDRTLEVSYRRGV